ncbi:MAG: translation initiation factor IF-2 [Anaerolineae bacterium]
MAEQEITIPEVITVRDLADLLGETPIAVIKSLMSNGVLASINQQVDFDTAAIIAAEFGYEAKQPYAELEQEAETELSAWQVLLANEDPQDLESRPPVVAVLGHVDHGKTSLLDAIRHTDVVGGESGGITQHIGAYQIKHGKRRITFLDTPGHEAFTAMRARGAHTTDIAVLVVAADDGVKPQTIEAINHARAAHVPIIVALNKMDKVNARPEVVKQELAELGLTPDEWGGKTMVIPVSAKMKTGLDDLLEAILLVADEVEVQANPDRKEAVGTVLEGRLDKQRGPLATVLVQNGTLSTGDVVVVGKTWGKIRALFDENNVRHRTAPPATPTVVIGLHDVPEAGDLLKVVKDERAARAIAEKRQEEAKQRDLTRPSRPLSLDDFSSAIRAGQAKELNVVLKTDVQGSIEPIVNSIERLGDQDLKVNVIHAAAGNITESDINLALASDAIVLGFRVSADSAARRMADMEGMDIKIYDIIYRLVDDVEKALQGLLEPTYQQVLVGEAEVRQLFNISSIGTIAGCYVTRGLARRNAKVRVVRDDEVIYDGDIDSLKRFTEDVREVRQNFECGVKVDGFNDLQVGDLLQFYVTRRVEQEA